MTVTRHLLITGRVQGVGFRFYMQRKARELGINGWVRNRRDGTVEALVQGDEASVQHILEWCRHGPAASSVTELGTREVDADSALLTFEVRPTE